jgi:omega-amidase
MRAVPDVSFPLAISASMFLSTTTMKIGGWSSYRRTFALWISSASLSSTPTRAFSVLPSSVKCYSFIERHIVSGKSPLDSPGRNHCSRRSVGSVHRQSKLMMSSASTNDSTDVSDASRDRNKQLRVALCQFHVTEDKQVNLQTCARYIDQAMQMNNAEEKKVDLIVLPEIWNSPYATSAFADYAEPLPDLETADPVWTNAPSASLLQQKAMEHEIWIVGGSIPERDAANDNKLYNTCLVFNPKGQLVAKHRKVHLFDINVPGGITFFESDTLSSGSQVTSFPTPWCNIGIGICYDIRFPEYALLLAKTCQMLIYPGAFNLVTGPAHWELLQRGRAVDTQCYVLTASPARTVATDENKGRYPPYTAWGHSTVVAPWGDVIATTDENESIVVADIDLTKVDAMRQSIPVRNQRRTDLYTLDKTA